VPITIAKKKMTLPGWSTVPGRDCGDRCRFCLSKCYAMKAWRQYPDVKTAWTKNGDSARANDGIWQGEIGAFLARKNPPYFRIHVSGDFMDGIPGRVYFSEWVRVARAFPLTRFLAFTKCFETVNTEPLPRNMEILYSAFPGMDVPRDGNRIAFAGSPELYRGSLRYRASRAHVCKGYCDDCLQCWYARKDRKDILLPFH
jgi:hypothetical protein